MHWILSVVFTLLLHGLYIFWLIRVPTISIIKPTSLPEVIWVKYAGDKNTVEHSACKALAEVQAITQDLLQSNPS